MYMLLAKSIFVCLMPIKYFVLYLNFGRRHHEEQFRLAPVPIVMFFLTCLLVASLIQAQLLTTSGSDVI